MTLRLNIDVGELDDEPHALASLAHLVNVACGAHAGDAHTAAAVIRRALASGASIGAHPSYPDREGFGRTRMHLDDDALRATLDTQLAWLRDIADAVGATVTHLKLHGALYHAATDDPRIADAVVVSAFARLGAVAFIGAPRGALREAVEASGVPYLRESFADRGYRDDGSLVARGEPGAVLTDVDAVRAQVQRLVREGGSDTLCVHGDNPEAVAIARAVRAMLA